MIISDRGLGSLFGLGDLVPLPNYEDPGYPPDAAIVARNNAKNAQYGLDLEKAQADNNFRQCLANAQNATSVVQYNDTIARCNGQYSQQTPDLKIAAPGVTNYNSQATFRFITSRPGGTLYPGDTWQIVITGAVPGSQVSTNGSFNGTPYYPGTQGTIDSSGQWSKSGVISSGDVGVWQENWVVNGQVVGQANFNVVVTQSNQTAPLTGSGTSNNKDSKGTSPPSTTGTDNTNLPFDLSGMSTIEMVGIGAAALAVIVLIVKK